MFIFAILSHNIFSSPILYQLFTCHILYVTILTSQKFRLHKEAKAEQVTLFYTEWEKYLYHIERTGRENKAINAGLLDGVQQESSQSYIDNTMVKQHTTTNNNRTFGQNVPQDIELNDEQKTQLVKLREEAVKAG